jgi:hypothetical protein
LTQRADLALVVAFALVCRSVSLLSLKLSQSQRIIADSRLAFPPFELGHECTAAFSKRNGKCFQHKVRALTLISANQRELRRELGIGGAPAV